MRRRHIVKLWLLVLMLTMDKTAHAQDEVFPVRSLPPEGRALGDFLPQGWTIEQEVSGDLNGHGLADMAPILIQDHPRLDESGALNERQWGLLVLLRHE